MVEAKVLTPDTLALHGGGFAGHGAEPAAARPFLESDGLGGPANRRVALLEERMALLEGGVGAVATSSAAAALVLAVATLTGAGGHVVAAIAPGSAHAATLRHGLARFGIATTIVHPRDADAMGAAMRPETRLVFGELIGPCGLEVLDVPAAAAIAHAAPVPLLVDSGAATPWLCRPLDHGADLVLHDATGWLSGGGAAAGGVLVDGGTFDWDAGAYPTLSLPSARNRGVSFTEEYGPAAFVHGARAEGLPDLGIGLGPLEAARILDGVQTLAWRMRGHVHNARAVVAFLESDMRRTDGAVAWIAYPELADHPDHRLAATLLPRGAGGIVGFGLRGGRAAGRRFVEALRLVVHGAATGGGVSAALLPAGIGEDAVRLSVGLEDCADLIDDLKAALRAAAKG